MSALRTGVPIDVAARGRQLRFAVCTLEQGLLLDRALGAHDAALPRDSSRLS